MTDHDVLPTLDWDRFVAAHWDRRPVRIVDCGRAPFVAEAVLRAASRAAGIEASPLPYAQFTLDRAQQTDPRPALPRAGERDLAAYARRLAELAGGRRHAVIVNRLHGFDHALWRRERDWFSPLWARVGLPSGSAITTWFHGDYDHSPIGVHKDRFATFMFVLAGRKRMRFWADRPWREPVTTMVDYAAYLPQSFAVELGPGEALYWPASYYHVGETAGDGAATSVNVGIPRGEQHRHYDIDDLLSADDVRPARGAARIVVPAPPCVALSVDAQRDADAGAPAVWRDAAADLRRCCVSRRLAASARRVALARAGAGGFEPVPPPAKRPTLAPGDMLQRTPGVRLLWSAAAGAPVLVGADGHVADTALDAATVARLISLLDDGRAHPLRRLRALAADVPARRALDALLADLVAWRALRRRRG
jgi:hypothetical protein